MERVLDGLSLVLPEGGSGEIASVNKITPLLVGSRVKVSRFVLVSGVDLSKNHLSGAERECAVCCVAVCTAHGRLFWTSRMRCESVPKKNFGLSEVAAARSAY